MGKIQYISIIAGFIILQLFSFQYQKQESKKLKESYESIISFNEAEKKQLINSGNLDAKFVSSMKQNIMSVKGAMDNFEKELSGFKRAQSLFKAEILTEITGVKVDYDSIAGKFDGISVNDNYIHKDTVDKYFLRVPTVANYSDKWLKYSATIDHDFSLDSLRLINKFDVVIGEKKQDKPLSFLRKKIPTVEMKSYNPYSSVPYINNIVFKEPKSKFQSILTSKAAMFGYGFATSTIINNL